MTAQKPGELPIDSPAVSNSGDPDQDFRKELLELIPFLRAFSRSLCGDRELADDLAQDALAKAWQSRATFRAGSNLKAWLFTILRNQFYSDRRRAWRQAPWDDGVVERMPVAGGEQTWAIQLSDMARAMHMLPAEQREALILVGAGGFYEAAAKIANCAIGTVKSRVARARMALTAILERNTALPNEPRPSGRDATHEIIQELDRLAPHDSPDGNEGFPTTDAKETFPEPSRRSLRLRLLLTVILALVPAAIVNVIEGVDRIHQDISAARERLIQTAATAASGAEDSILSAEQILRGLAARPEVRRAQPGCAEAVTNALQGYPSSFVNLARLDGRGEAVCAASPSPELAHLSAGPWWTKAKTDTEFFITPELYNITAQRSVVAGILPMRDVNGDFGGVLAIAWDTASLDSLLRGRDLPSGAAVAIFDSSNTILSASDRMLAGELFRDAKPPEKGRSGQLISAIDGHGNAWSYAVAPLTIGNLYVAFAMPERELFRGSFVRVATDLLLPVLMLGLASIAIWFATDRLVLRWINYLRRIASAYAKGHYAIRPVVLEEAPSEFRILGETFSAMAAAVQDRDRSLREALAQKSLLIKETHHRVKNNLQIVMSLLSLQANQLRDPAAQNALKQAQIRVNALALVHRILHELENLETVDLKRLLHDLVMQIHEGFGASRRDLKVELDIVERQVSSDIAVPLTLFTVEVLTNAFKHAYPNASSGGVIRLSLLPAAEKMLRLTIEDDGSGIETKTESGGIGSRLIKAFAQQIGGSVTTQSRNSGGTIVAIVFPDPLVPDVLSETETA